MADRKPLDKKHVPGTNLKFKLMLNMSFSTPYNLEKKKDKYNQKVNKLNRFFKKKYGEKKVSKIDISKFIKRDFFKLCDSKKGVDNLEDFLKEKPALRKKIKKVVMDELIDQTGMDETEVTDWKKEELDSISKQIDEKLPELEELENKYEKEIKKFENE